MGFILSKTCLLACLFDSNKLLFKLYVREFKNPTLDKTAGKKLHISVADVEGVRGKAGGGGGGGTYLSATVFFAEY